VSAAGPFVTLLLAVGMLGAAYALNTGPSSNLAPLTLSADMEPWLFALTTLGWINVFLLFFNLIPAYPLDGGRIARSIIWKWTGDEHRATLISATIGRYFGYALMAFGVVLLPRSIVSGGLFIFMGWSLAQSARGATIQDTMFNEARELRVADVMDRQPVVMPADATVQRALDEFFWRYRWPWFPVVDSTGHFLGLIEQHAVERVDEDDRSARHASDLIAPQSGNKRAVNQSTPLTAVLANPELRDFGALMAVDEQGVLSGVVTVEQVQRALSDAIRRATAVKEPPSDL
jgi:CBS domain-containing protein